MQNLQFTAIIQQGNDGYYVGQIAEEPAALSQGHTIDELEENLLDALHLVWKTNRMDAKKRYAGQKTIRRKLEITLV